jgi:hypothetical protein
MEALRNFVQHRGDVVHSITISYPKDPMKALVRIDIFLDPKILKSDKKFKASVLSELTELPNQETLQIYLMDFLEVLQEVHKKFRTSTNVKNSEAHQCITEAFDQYQKVFGNAIGLQAIEISDVEMIRKSFPINLAPFEMLEFYKQKNII